MILECADLSDDGLQILPDFIPEGRVGNVLHGSQRLASGLVMPVLIDTYVSFYGIQPTQDFGLHHEDSFQHLIGFGHAGVPSGCVRTPSLSASGMALYNAGGVA